MPRTAKRNGSVILFDVKTNPEFAKAAKKCLLNICASKWFSKSKDTTKLLLLNKEEKEKILLTKFGKCLGKCPHIYEATDEICYNPKLFIPHLEDVATAEADWLMGLAAALEELQENYEGAKGIMNMQLLFITDFSTPVTPKKKLIEYVIKAANKMRVRLFILGPEVRVPSFMSSFNDLEQFSSNIEFIDDEKSNPNLAIAKRIVQETKGIVCNLQLGQELFKNYFEHWSLRPWKVPLTIGSSVTFSTSASRFLRGKAPPRIRKYRERCKWYRERCKWHLVGDVLTEIPYSNLIGGVFKHGKFVALPADVEKNFKHVGARCFKIIGFTEQRNVPDFLQQGKSHFVECDDSKGFELLLHVLANQNKCAIAVKVDRQNCRPILVVLFPRPQERVFIMGELPYSDGTKAILVEQNLNDAPKLEADDPAVSAMYDYLQQCDIGDPNNRDENGSVRIPLAATLMESFWSNVVVKHCLQKYLDEDMEVEDGNILLPEFVDTTPYKQFFPVIETAEPKKEKRDNEDMEVEDGSILPESVDTTPYKQFVPVEPKTEKRDSD